MQKLHTSIVINAPKEKVWDIMLSDETYRDWTSAFNPGSYYKGEWKEGSKILFLGPNPAGGGEGGMVSYVETLRPYEYVSILHKGIVNNGNEITEGPEVEGWAGAHENYTFNEKDGGTELVIDMDLNESEKDMMEQAWQKALVRLKELAEK